MGVHFTLAMWRVGMSVTYFDIFVECVVHHGQKSIVWIGLWNTARF